MSDKQNEKMLLLFAYLFFKNVLPNQQFEIYNNGKDPKLNGRFRPHQPLLHVSLVQTKYSDDSAIISNDRLDKKCERNQAIRRKYLDIGAIIVIQHLLVQVSVTGLPPPGVNNTSSPVTV